MLIFTLSVDNAANNRWVKKAPLGSKEKNGSENGINDNIFGLFFYFSDLIHSFCTFMFFIVRNQCPYLSEMNNMCPNMFHS